MAATADTKGADKAADKKPADAVAEIKNGANDSDTTRTTLSQQATMPGDATTVADKPNTAKDHLPAIVSLPKDAGAALARLADKPPVPDHLPAIAALPKDAPVSNPKPFDAKNPAAIDHLPVVSAPVKDAPAAPPRAGDTRIATTPDVLPSLEQTKAPTLDRKTLEQTAEEIHSALHRTTFGLNRPDREKVTRILGPLTQADRQALEQIYEDRFGDKTKAKALSNAIADNSGIDHTTEFQSSFLRQEIAGRFKGPNSVEQAEITSIMNRVDGKTNDAGALMVAINRTRDDSDRDNVAIRAVFETLNEGQIKELDQNFRRDYGKTWQQALGELGDDVKPQTLRALEILHKGTDHKSPQDVKDLARIAVDAKDPRLLGEALRGTDSETRKQLLEDPKFMKDLTIAFPKQGWTSQSIENLYQRADANGKVPTGFGHKLDLGTLLDPVARDYLTEGRISLSTITTQDTGKWLLDDRENVALAAKNVSASERQQFILGAKLTEEKREPKTQEEKDAKSYYDKIHQTLSDRGNPREVTMWESLLKHGRENIVTEMAETHSNAWGPFGWGSKHSRQDLMSRAENLSQKDYDLLRDPVKGKDFRREIEESLTKYADEGERTRIMKMLELKAAKPTYEESKQVHRLITETIADNKGHDFMGMGTSYDAKNILNNFTSMTPEDAAKIKANPAYAKELRDFLTNDSEFSKTEQLLAQRMIDKAEKAGTVPKPDELDKLLRLTAGGDGKKQEILIQAQKALEADPQLRARLSGSREALSPEDRIVRDLIVEKYQSGRARHGRYDQSGRETIRAVDKFIETGKLSIQDKFNLRFDRKSLVEAAATASPEERAGLRERFRPDELKVIDSAAANGGKFSLADRIQLMSMGLGEKVQDFKPELERLHTTKDGLVELQRAKDEFTQKYGRSLDDVVLSAVEPQERSNFRTLLTATDSDGRQTFYDNVWSALQSDSGASAGGTGLTMRKSIDQTANSLEEYQRIYKSLPLEKQRELDEFFNKSLEQHKQSKEKLAELVITATITAAALAAAPFTAGASAAALAAYASIAAAGGAALSVGTHWAIEGNDYSKDKVIGNVVHGAIAGGLIFAMPPAGSVAAVFGQGAKAIVTDTAVVTAMTGVRAAERAAVEKALAKTLMQTGKNFGEKEALEVLKQAAPSLTGDASQQVARQLAESVAKNYGTIDAGVTVLRAQAADAGKNTAAQLGKQVLESSAIGGVGNFVATLADAPFNPNGLDVNNLLTQTFVGATVGAIMPVAFKGAISGTKYVLNISKETNAVTGVAEAIVHAKPGEPVQIRHADGTVETVTGKAKLQNGDQILSGPEAPPATAKPESGAERTSVAKGSGDSPSEAQPVSNRHEKGQLVNEKNQLIDERGRLVNERGQTVNEHNQVIDSKGNLIESEFPTYPQSEFDRVRPELVQDLHQWKTLDGKNVGEEFDKLAQKLKLTEAEKNQILDGLQTVREHGARLRDIDPEQAINWKHTEREFGAAVDYAARNNFTKEQTQDLLLSAMFSDGLKTKFNFTTHNVDGAAAFEQFAKQHLKDLPADRIAGIKQAILEHQVAPPEFMAMIYGGAIMGSIKAENRAMTDVETAALNSLKAKISNPFALGPDGLIEVPGAPQGAKAVKLTPDEQALLNRTGLDHWYVPNEGNVWNRFSRGLIDADGIDNYAGPGGLSKIVGLRGPGKAAFFQDRHVLFGNPENPTQISSVDSWKQSQRDFLGDPKTGKLGAASPEARQFVEQQSANIQANIDRAQSRVNEWINSPAGRTELGLPADGPIDKIPGWTGTKDKPDLIDYSTATPEELNRARKLWDRFGDELVREQRVNLNNPPEYSPMMRTQTDRGQMINERGQKINDQGQVIDSRGNPIESEFPPYPQAEFDRVRPELVDDLHSWKTLDGKNVGEEFDNLVKKLDLSEAEKNQILDGLQTVREHGARMREIDPEQAINWKHTEREFGAAVDYAARNNFTKEQTQDLLLSAMFSDGLKTKFNFTTHNVDGATAFEQFAKQHLKDFPAQRIAGIKQAILEHQVAPPEFMAMIYGGAIMGSIKAENRAMTDVETAALNSLKAKISNPFALGPDGLIEVPAAPKGAKAVKLTPDEQALLSRTGLDHWYVPSEGNAWNRFSRGLIDADGIDNYAGPGGLSKIIGLRGPGKAAFFQDRHVLFGNPENASQISSVDSWKQSQKDFLGDPAKGKLGAATEQARKFVEQQSSNIQANIDRAQNRVNEWINSPAGRAELGLPPEGAIDKIPGWTGTKDKPDLIDYSTATPEELNRARKLWDRFGDELGREQRVHLRTTPDYTPVLQRGGN